MTNSQQTAAAQEAAAAAVDKAVAAARTAHRVALYSPRFSMARGIADDRHDAARLGVDAACAAYGHACAAHDEMVNYERRFGVEA